jgi:membrane associated rhomboid family serine protease
VFIPLRDYIPARRTPVVTQALLAANVLVWFWQLLLSLAGASWVVPGYGLVPARLSIDPAGEAFTLLTSMFMHDDLLHIGGNMLFLYVFGDNVEDALGRLRYLGFYLLCGVIASLGHYLVDPASPLPLVGASGAIYGVLGAYMVLYPRSPVLVFNTVFLLWFVIGPVPVLPAWFVAGGYFVMDVIRGYLTLGADISSGTAYFAHIAGFGAGLLLVRWWARAHAGDSEVLWRPPPSGPPPSSEWRDPRRR